MKFCIKIMLMICLLSSKLAFSSSLPEESSKFTKDLIAYIYGYYEENRTYTHEEHHHITLKISSILNQSRLYFLTPWEEPVLHFLIHRGNNGLVPILINALYDENRKSVLNIQDEHKQSILHIYLLKKMYLFAKKLIKDYGADSQIPNSAGQTVLYLSSPHYAEATGQSHRDVDITFLNFLLRNASIDWNLELHLTLQTRDVNFGRFAIQNGADPIAVFSEVLERNPATAEFFFFSDEVCLHQIMTLIQGNRNIELYKFIDKYPHAINLSNSNRQTPLHVAVQYGRSFAVRKLLESLDARMFHFQNHQAEMALHLAARLENQNIYRMLAGYQEERFGESIDPIVNIDAQTAEDVANSNPLWDTPPSNAIQEPNMEQHPEEDRVSLRRRILSMLRFFILGHQDLVAHTSR